MLPEYKKIKRKNMLLVSEIIPTEIEKINRKNGVNTFDIKVLKNNWDRLVGESISKVTTPQKIIKGKLIVTCTSSAWKNELVYHKNDLLKRIQVEIGSELVQDISFS